MAFPDLPVRLAQLDPLAHREKRGRLGRVDLPEISDHLERLAHQVHQAREDLPEARDRLDRVDLRALADRTVHRDNRV